MEVLVHYVKESDEGYIGNVRCSVTLLYVKDDFEKLGFDETVGTRILIPA